MQNIHKGYEYRRSKARTSWFQLMSKILNDDTKHLYASPQVPIIRADIKKSSIFQQEQHGAQSIKTDAMECCGRQFCESNHNFFISAAFVFLKRKFLPSFSILCCFTSRSLRAPENWSVEILATAIAWCGRKTQVLLTPFAVFNFESGSDFATAGFHNWRWCLQ